MGSYKDALERYIKGAEARRASRAGSITSSLLSSPDPIIKGAAQQGATVSRAKGGEFEQFLNSIAKQESGNKYKAVNSSSGALGKYQIMPANIPSWSKEALGRSITPQAFLRNPRLQERVARYKLRQYYRRYGAAGAAKAWYGGESAARKSSSTRQGSYPSINSYASQVTSRLK
jgi:hypothetical protein